MLELAPRFEPSATFSTLTLDPRRSMRHGYLRGALVRTPTARQVAILAAFIATAGSVADAAELMGIRPHTAKRHLADLRARSGLTTGGSVMTVGHAACARRDWRGSVPGVRADQFRGRWPTSPSPAQPAFENVGMNR